MPLLNKESITGILTPNIYISRITLESVSSDDLNAGGTFNSKVADRVHIHTQNIKMVEETNDAGQLIGWVPEKPIETTTAINDSAAFVNYPESQLKITADMVLKQDIFDISEFWAGNESLQDYVNILSFYLKTEDSHL